MAAVSVSANNTRLNDAEATTEWGSDGGGAGGALETDFFYQGSNCYARKGGTAQRGIFHSDSVNTDASTATGTYQTYMVKYVCTTPGLLESVATPGLQIRLGSGSTTASASSAYYAYDVQGNDTYPIDKSWLVVPINPNIASHRSSTGGGGPTLTAMDMVGLWYDQTGTSKSPNQGLDAVDIGAGLVVEGGDGADADATWQDLSDADWGTNTARYGYIREAEGVYLVYGMMVMGTATDTVFTDSNQTIVWPDGLFAAGFSGYTVDYSTGNAFSETNIAHIGQGTEAGEDTRPVLLAANTGGTGTATVSGNTYINWASLVMDSKASFTGCTILNCGLVTLNEADISNTSILTSTVAADEGAVLDDRTTTSSTSLTEYTGCSFSQGTNAHHAIRFGTGVDDDLTLTGVDFTGFSGTDDVNGSTFRFDATSGSLTLSLIDCTVDGGAATPANIGIDDAAGITVTLSIDPVTTLINIKDENGNNEQDVRVYLQAADGTGDLPFEESVTITRSGTTATVSHTAHGLNSNEYVKLKGITDKIEDNSGAFQITVTDANTYTYTTTNSGSTSYTGSITATGVTIYGATDASGNISSSRTYGANQPLTGYARKATTAPYYKMITLDSTVSSSTGLTINRRLVLDQ
jgi:hypothetical protein